MVIAAIANCKDKKISLSSKRKHFRGTANESVCVNEKIEEKEEKKGAGHSGLNFFPKLCIFVTMKYEII